MSLQARVALFFYVILGFILKLSWGLFHPFILIVLSVAFFLFCWYALRHREGEAQEQFPTAAPTLATLFAFQAFLLWHGSINPKEKPAGLIFTVDGAWLDLLRAEYGPLALLLTVGLVLWAIVIVWKRVPAPAFYLCVALALGILSWQRLAVLHVSPAPYIDTFEVNNAACDFLLNGKNPYAADAQYEDIYHGGFDYQAAFPYWPTYLYWALPFRCIFGDIRYGTWAADLVTALFLWATARRLGLDLKTSCLVPLVWLSFPINLFVLEQAWIDPILVMATAGLLWAVVARHWVTVGIMLALVCGVKQYGVLVAGFAILCIIRQEMQGWVAELPDDRNQKSGLQFLERILLERGHLVRMLGAMTITLAVLFVPFLVLDARSFYDRTVKVYLNPTLRSDALSWPAAAKHFWQSDYVKRKGLQDRIAALEPPSWFLPALYLTIVGYGGMRIWRAKEAGLSIWAAVLAFSLGTIFLFGKIAFCNYYYFVAFLVLMYLLLSLPPRATKSESKFPSVDA